MTELEGWVARDMDGKLFLYKLKPLKDLTVWYSPGFSLALGRTPFPEIKWSDDEPTKVKLVIEK